MTKKGKTELLKKAQNYVFVDKCESVIDLNLKIFLISQRVPSQGKYSGTRLEFQLSRKPGPT